MLVHTGEQPSIISKVAIASGIGTLALVIGMRTEADPAKVRFSEFTKPGGCLFQTDYDPKVGAEVHWGQANGEADDTLVLEPRSGSSASDMTLLFGETSTNARNFFMFIDGDETAHALFDKCLQD